MLLQTLYDLQLKAEQRRQKPKTFPRQLHMLGTCFITQRLTTQYELPNKTSQSLPLINVHPTAE